MFDEKNLDDIHALTPMQEGMLFHYLKDTSSDLYVEQLSLEVSGTLVDDYFDRAWYAVVQANEMLRSVFRWNQVKHPVQIVLKHPHVRIIKYVDRDYSEPEVIEITRMDRVNGFDLQEIPFRVTLCKRNNETYKIIISNHHILYDGWSNGIILKEFFSVYNGLVNGENIRLPLKTKFKTFLQFIQWNLDHISLEHENYWKTYLEGFETPTELSFKKVLPVEPRHRQPAVYSFPLQQEIDGLIREFSREHQVTPAALFYCAWGLLVQSCANNIINIDGIENLSRATNI